MQAVDPAELIRLTSQAGAVHEIRGMKSCDERGAAWRRGFVESLIGSYFVTFSGECQSFNSASSAVNLAVGLYA
jgi:hypothetical protein